MLKQIRPALVLLVALTVITGLVYPLAITGIAQVALPGSGEWQPDRAGRHGRRLRADRPGLRRTTSISTAGLSATTAPDPTDSSKTVAAPYNAANSGGSNLGPTSKALADRLKGDVGPAEAGELGRAGAARPGDHIRQRARPAHHAGGGAVPGAAGRQGARSARAAACATWCRTGSKGALLGLLGEPRVNVLDLNLALDRLRS